MCVCVCVCVCMCVCVCVCVCACVRERLHISPSYQLIDDQTEASDSNRKHMT